MSSVKSAYQAINGTVNQIGSDPDANGFFGQYGGRFVAETLMRPLLELEEACHRWLQDPDFVAELAGELRDYVGRPTPIYHARRWSSQLGGAQLWLKREDLAHTGAHKINNTMGQALLAQRLGKSRIIAETGAGQHGVATATVAARLGLPCCVYMGAEDMRRQALNVYRMKLLGAEVQRVDSGTRTLKDAMNEALRDWVANVDNTCYIIGSVAGPHPYPWLVRELQSVIGREARKQCLSQLGRLPDELIACVGGGSNAMGLFQAFLHDEAVRMIGVEAGGRGLDSGSHAATITAGRVGILHGSRSMLLQDDEGQVIGTHSVSAGLDYPGVGPEHALLHDSGRVEYCSVNDDEALQAFHALAGSEGILPALESCHALAWAASRATSLDKNDVILVNLSGRGDKDIETVAGASGLLNE